MDFQFEPLTIPDIVLVRPGKFEDARGFFRESYRASAFEAAGITVGFSQDNLARSTRGVLRGLHYQLPPAEQGKLVGVVQGRVWDVAVDLRVGGSTYGQWVAHELDVETGELLWIPPGFAHGYVVLSDVALVSYKVTTEYRGDLDRGVLWNDPALAIDWPVDDPVVSAKDQAQPPLDRADNPFRA